MHEHEHEFGKLNEYTIFCACGEVRSATLHNIPVGNGYEAWLGRMRVLELDQTVETENRDTLIPTTGNPRKGALS